MTRVIQMRYRLLEATTALATALAIGCGGVDPPQLGNAPMLSRAATTTALIEHDIAPNDTDSAIQGLWLTKHYVSIDPAVNHGGKLFVHLPGTNNPPSSFKLVAREATRLGYHVIVLMYPNTLAITVCGNDPACEESLRLEIIDGIDRTSLIPVTRAHSIYNRLTKLLQHLDENFPNEGWSEFLKHGEPKWSKIVISGFSFGGSEATMLAKLHRVHRVTLFAAPRDADAAGLPPAWVALGATPANRYYGLVHKQDPLSALTLASWKAPLGMLQFGEAVFEDASMSSPPYGGTHMLVTERPPSTGLIANAHGSVSVDQLTPRAPDGTPALGEAWRYMLGERYADEELADDQDDQDETSVERGAADTRR
jgi:hypothetical protein